MAILARGESYFGKDGFPVTVRMARTDPSGKPSHPHDYTEVDHYHDFSELVVVMSGRGCHMLEGESFPVSAGSVFVVQGKQVHSFRDREGLVLANVMYDPQQLPLPENLLRRLPGYSALFMLEPTFRSEHRFSSRLRLDRENLGTAETLVEKIARESTARQPGHEVVLLGALLELIAFLSRCYNESDASESRWLLRMGRLISELENRYAEPWTLDTMAEFSHLSRTHLLRMFRSATGQSPIQFLINLRIEAAKRLLRQTDIDMTRIAQESGFCDSNYFARKFRQGTGRSPTEYRAATRV